MSLNKFTDDVLKSWMKINAGTIKCGSLEVGGSIVGSAFEYTPTLILTAPAGMTSTAPAVFWHTNGDQMSLSVRSFDLTIPSSSNAIQFEIPLPTGYRGFGAGFEKFCLVGSVVDPANGNAFLPVVSLFTLDNLNLVCNFKSSTPHSGTFNISLSITAKIVKL